MPPPLSNPSVPLAILRSVIVTVPLVRSKTRLALPPLTVSVAAPGPLITRSSLIASSPPLSTMLPTTFGANAIASMPGLVLAALIASRSVQLVASHAPSSPSAAVLTVKAAMIGVGVLLGVGVFVGVFVAVGVLVGVGVSVGVLVAVGVLVRVAVAVLLGVGVLVGAAGWSPKAMKSGCTQIASVRKNPSAVVEVAPGGFVSVTK